LVASATSNYVAWCVQSHAFVNRCHYVSPGVYTTDMSASASLSLNASAASEVSLNSMRVHIAEVSRALSLPLTNAADSSDGVARIGQQPVVHQPLRYTSDMSISQDDAAASDDAAWPNAGPSAWSFVDSSASVTLRWFADGSHSHISTSMDPCVIRVQKSRNDAACDYIRGGGSDVSGADLPPGLSTSAADTLLAQFDYAETYPSQSQLNCVASGATLAVTVSDSVFTQCVAELLDASGSGSGGTISSTEQLRNALNGFIDAGHLCGLRSVVDVSVSCGVLLSGTDRAAEAPVVGVSPHLFFHTE
jgi:hypothetical protein